MKKLVLIAALLAGCVETATAGDPSSAFNTGDWLLATVDVKPVDWQATLNLGDKGKFSGQAPCNRYFGALDHSGDKLTLGPIGATRIPRDSCCQKMCGAMHSTRHSPGAPNACSVSWPRWCCSLCSV